MSMPYDRDQFQDIYILDVATAFGHTSKFAQYGQILIPSSIGPHLMHPSRHSILNWDHQQVYPICRFWNASVGKKM